MKMNEMFVSLQGEGKNRGKPSIFLRMSGCNLKCVWCDSTYANEQNKDISYSAVSKFISSNKDTKHLVFTGGEPLLQQKYIARLLNHFPKHSFEIETNGTQNICDDLLELGNKGFFTVSPKLQNSGNKPELCKISKCFLNELCSMTYFKFVVSSYEDFRDINEFVNENNLIHDRVYIMPECTSMNEMIVKGKGLVYPCIKNGYRLTTREQLIWNVK